MAKISCCLCMRDDEPEDMMQITVRVAKDMSIPEKQSRGVVCDQATRTATYNLCGPSCLEIWAAVIATVCDPDNPVTKKATAMMNLERGVPNINMKKSRGQN